MKATRGSPDVCLLGHCDKRLQLNERHATMLSRVEPGLDTDWVLDAAAGLLHQRGVAIIVYGPVEREALRRAGKCAAATLAAVCKRVESGVTTAEIDLFEHTVVVTQSGVEVLTLPPT